MVAPAAVGCRRLILVVVVLEAVSARDIVVEVLSVAVKYLLGFEHFWLAGQDCEHVSAISPRHKVDMHLAKKSRPTCARV
jgi:hypothetical protein